MGFLLIAIFAGLLSIAHGREFSIRSQRDFVHAVNSVRPGDTIHLLRDTTYHLGIELTKNGQQHAPITLTGERGTKITGDNTAILLRGSFWRIQNLDFENIRSGIIVNGHNNTLKSLSFHDIEDEGIILNGNGNIVRNCVFNGANHGIVIYGRDNQLVKNSITCMGSTVQARHRSCCGLLEQNVFNGLLEIQGGDFGIVKNTANSDVSIGGKRNNVRRNVINGRLDVRGCGNFFYGNTAGSTDFTGTCYNWDDGKNNFGLGHGGHSNTPIGHHSTFVAAKQ